MTAKDICSTGTDVRHEVVKRKTLIIITGKCMLRLLSSGLQRLTPT